MFYFYINALLFCVEILPNTPPPPTPRDILSQLYAQQPSLLPTSTLQAFLINRAKAPIHQPPILLEVIDSTLASSLLQHPPNAPHAPNTLSHDLEEAYTSAQARLAQLAEAEQKLCKLEDDEAASVADFLQVVVEYKRAMEGVSDVGVLSVVFERGLGRFSGSEEVWDAYANWMQGMEI